MRKLLVLLVVGFLAILLGLAFWPDTSDPPPVFLRQVSVPPPPPTTRAKPPRVPDAGWVDAAREILGDSLRDTKCGPYLLITDVQDKTLLTACELLAARLDDLYLERYGLEPRGEPVEAIFLFAEAKDFRAFAARDGRLPVGYAGYSNAARGFTALYAGDQPLLPILTTLAHELTHLVNRRALGPNLPPWIAEGLADGIGDTATAEGFLPLTGVLGTAPQATRLRTAYDQGQAQSLQRLTALDRGTFDREVPSYDYEQSALFVRYLLADASLRPRFLAFLKDLARAPYEQKRLEAALGVSWNELNGGFEEWLRKASQRGTGR